MFLKILFGLGLLFLAEMAVMALVARFLGAVVVIVIIASTALAGAFVLVRLGPAAMRRLRINPGSSAVPDEGILHTLLLFLAGVLLITPGIIADLLGLMLILPCFRSLTSGLARRLAEKLVNRGAIKVTRLNQGNPWQK